MESIPRTARQRLVTEAARLFAERGYAATSVADIQQACGLTSGSGALYKHFPSKRALLEEVIGVHLSTMREGNELFLGQVPDDLEQALRFLADAMWASMRRDRDILRVTLRDLDDFPDLLDRVWTELKANVYDAFAGWLASQADRGTVHVDDPEASAAVLLSSLTYPAILNTLIGHTPGDLDAARYRAAWIQHAISSLTSHRDSDRRIREPPPG